MDVFLLLFDSIFVYRSVSFISRINIGSSASKLFWLDMTGDGISL